jgi:hypothetical protein
MMMGGQPRTSTSSRRTFVLRTHFTSVSIVFCLGLTSCDEDASNVESDNDLEMESEMLTPSSAPPEAPVGELCVGLESASQGGLAEWDALGDEPVPASGRLRIVNETRGATSARIRASVWDSEGEHAWQRDVRLGFEDETNEVIPLAELAAKHRGSAFISVGVEVELLDDEQRKLESLRTPPAFLEPAGPGELLLLSQRAAANRMAALDEQAVLETEREVMSVLAGHSAAIMVQREETP